MNWHFVLLLACFVGYGALNWYGGYREGRQDGNREGWLRCFDAWRASTEKTDQR